MIAICHEVVCVPSAVFIRMAAAGDARPLAALMTELGYPTAEDEMATRLRRILARSDHLVAVAVCEGEVVGAVAATIGLHLEMNGRHGRVTALIVTAGHRGRGIGELAPEEIQVITFKNLLSARRNRLAARSWGRRLHHQLQHAPEGRAPLLPARGIPADRHPLPERPSVLTPCFHSNRRAGAARQPPERPALLTAGRLLINRWHLGPPIPRAHPLPPAIDPARLLWLPGTRRPPPG